MSRTSIVSLLGLGAAVLVASRFEGALSVGVVAGYLCGASIALTSGLWVAHSVQHRPDRAMRSLLEGFLVKLGVLVVATVCMRYIPAVGAVADYRSFLSAYAGAAVLILLMSTLENSRRLRGESAA